MLYVLYFGFWAVAFVFTVSMFAFGGRTERWAAGMMFAAALFTPFAVSVQNSRWHSPQLGALAVDCMLLAGLLALAIHSRRFWPMTLVSFHLLAVLTHPALWLDHDILPFGYAFMQGFWAYPMMATVSVGAWRRRRRLASGHARHDDGSNSSG